jgi:hypothetical protein
MSTLVRPVSWDARAAWNRIMAKRVYIRERVTL